jgi:hypothetical protein
MLFPQASIGPGESSIVCFYINEIQQDNDLMELHTVISQSVSTPLLFLQTSYHIEISPNDPSMIANVIGNPFQMMEEGLLVSWGCEEVDIHDKAWLVRTNDSEGGCDCPFGSEESFH